MAEKAKFGGLWPDVNTIEQARAATMFGFWAAVIGASLTALIAGWAVFSGEAALGLIDGWAFVDVAIFAAVAVGIYKESRAAAVIGLLLFVANKLYMMAETGKATGIVMAVIFTLFYISGVRGTFALRRLRHGGVSSQATAPAGEA